ncbi:serine/threonine-protein kinase 19 isoform X2 [Neomonachus schauinslandi]|uniref:Serine/threonine-protein kinase 19 isoform X2 n=1 Tax=Neomonachus schauinslandi TaxID=29088 RepID=A0A8M1MI66_NEOSC|nr:serine/threonine-protein kinase 19 isoform X2 [Neomonachus schauinslandi]
MSRKRQRLVPDAFGLKRRRERGQAEADPLRGESGSARAAVAELVQLFPRSLFEDALPPIALRSQVYSLVPDRTAADRQLKALQEQGEIRIIQLGFDLDAHGIIFTEDYRTRGARLSLAWSGRPSTGSYSYQSFWAGGRLPRCDLASPTTCMTSLGPSWWTVSPPLLELSSACQRREDSACHCIPPQSGVRGAQEYCPVVAETGSPWEGEGARMSVGIVSAQRVRRDCCCLPGL